MVSGIRYRSVYSLLTILVALAALSSSIYPIAARAAVPIGPAAVAESGTLLLAPQDTSLNIDAANYSTHPLLMAYTWPDNQIANAVLMKFDLSALPAGATVQQAVLTLALVESDATADATYTMIAHKLVGKSPVIAAATGYTADGATPWTPSACCYNGVPMAQADLSAPYASLAVDKTPGAKTWTITTMVQDWLASPSSNFGLLLNSDASKLSDRYRFFASMENPDTSLRPFLRITFTAGDATPPTVTITAPLPGTISGTVPVSASATDNIGVAGVQFQLDRVPFGTELTAAPFTFNWDTTTLSDGAHVLAAVARDWAGNSGVSADIMVTVKNDFVLLSPQDTSLNTNATNYSTNPLLTTYTWPNNKVSNAVVMKFDLSALPPGAFVMDATLRLALVQRDATADATYLVAAHKMLGKNLLISKATGYTADGVTNWTASACCTNGAPLAQADISPFYDRQAIDKTLGFKSWTITTMVQEWLADPATNFGLLLNSDTTKLRDRYRYFASMENTDASLRPYLKISYSSTADRTPPSVSITAPAPGTVVSAVVQIQATATDNVGVAGVQFKLDGANLGAEDTATPYAASWNTATAANGSHTLTAVARDAAGNATTSVSVGATVANDTTPPVISGTTASAVTTSGATITWTTGEASDSQVEYGLTTTYGSSTTVNASLVTSHVVMLSGLVDGKLYHFRVRSRDAAGNLATSADFTFVTVDGTSPAVSITSPTAGAGVSGTVIITANASDNVGVLGVQFKLDGANLGAEDTTAAYSQSWTASTATNGSHSLTAVARDAAGNSRTSTAITVTVSNDTTAPVISGVGASAITTTAATMGWTTNEGSDSQVDSGLTTSYGTTSALNATSVTAHSVQLGGLTASTTYHARVRSRDAAGNLAMSPDFAFATSANPPPPPSGWPHEPAGFGVQSTSTMDLFTGNGWGIVNPSNYATIVADAGGSMTPAKVGRWMYPAGYGGGSAPATMYHALPSAFNEGFVGVMWKPSNPWQGHNSNVNKIFFLLGGACGNLIPIMYGPNGGPYQLRVAPEWGNWSWLTPNVNAVPIVLGAWHKIELYFSYSNHIVRWWMDGTLIGDYTNVTFPSSGCFSEFQFSPTWGGVGDVKNQSDYFWFDDPYISRPGTGTPPPPAPAPPPPAGTVLFQEGFDDANLAGRGWYDNTTPLLSTAEHIPGSTRSIQYTFNQGATSPTAGSALRKTFTPTDSIYLGYWEKYSTNWVGSQQPYHPHEFHVLTTLDGIWSGLSFNPLTTYIEQNGGTPLIAIQDGSNVDQSRIGVNLTNVTENRGVAGCNGSSDGYPDNCYSNGSAMVNEKKWRAAARYFTDTPGAFYKSDWHFVEAFIKMNSVVSGKGVNDGVVQYWFDGQLVIDRHDVLLRTATNASMKFDKLVIAPYIGDGSPVTQSLWIDSLTVGTGRP